MLRVGIYGWGIVAPRSRNIDAFCANLQTATSWLTPFDRCGPTTFLVGEPDFDFSDYRPWIEERFPPNKFAQLRKKMGSPTQYAIGAFVQALQQNPGIETTLQELGNATQVLVGTGLGDFPTQYDCSIKLHYAQLRWDRFWADPERNDDRRRYELAGTEEQARLGEKWGVPDDPRDLGTDGDILRDSQQEWNSFWMCRSSELRKFLQEFDRIEGQGVGIGVVESAKLSAIRRKKTAIGELEKSFGCPTPPWRAVSPDLLWNIPNTPAAQISMLGKITGPAIAPVAACASFGVALKCGVQAIRHGHAKTAIVGMADPYPHPLTVGSFYRARVLAADSSPSVPLTDLRGTHVSGGSCVWIIGEHEYMSSLGYQPLGLEIIGVGVTSDADHIITPSIEGPQESIRLAFEDAGMDPNEVETWDLHATSTPGDYREAKNLLGILPEGTLITARKGSFGHGMGVGGGWELTAQHLGIARGTIYPTLLTEETLNRELATLPFNYVKDVPCDAPRGVAGKLSMGVGGINSCVISRRWEDAPVQK